MKATAEPSEERQKHRPHHLDTVAQTVSAASFFCDKGNLCRLQGYTSSPNGDGIDWIQTPELWFVPFSSKLLCDFGLVISTLHASPAFAPIIADVSKDNS